MARTVVEKIAINLQLNNGSTSTGAIKIINVALGGSSQKINDTEYTKDDTGPTKALAISIAVARILAKAVYQTVEIRTSQITN